MSRIKSESKGLPFSRCLKWEARLLEIFRYSYFKEFGTQRQKLNSIT